MRAVTPQTGEYNTNNSQDTVRLIELIGKGSGGKSHVLDDTTTTLSQKNDCSMPVIMVIDATGKSASLIIASTFFT